MERYILITICTFLAIISFRLWYKSFSKAKQQQKRFKRGLKLEQKAAKFLVSKGFSVIGEQLAYEHSYKVNGETRTSTINIDYLVEKRGEVFVVEVKSGKSAISINNRSTRRQLLEYAITIDCNGVYLLDMENKELQLIEFQFPTANNVEIKNKGLLLVLFSLNLLLFYIIYSLLT